MKRVITEKEEILFIEIDDQVDISFLKKLRGCRFDIAYIPETRKDIINHLGACISVLGKIFTDIRYYEV